jgi:predicted glycosyltransferase
MRILFDICHPAHINLFKHTIHHLCSQQDSLIVTFLDRGKIGDIIRKEFPPAVKFFKVGRHRGSFCSIIFEANIARVFKMMGIMRKEKPGICLSAGSFTCGFAAKFCGVPNIQFDDDPERKMNLLLERITADELYFPPVLRQAGKIKTITALKEWAYLSPDTFSPDETILDKYNLVKKDYLFIREISNKSINYKNQKTNVIADIAYEIKKHEAILSLEDKNTRDQYPEHWIVLDEPVEDIHSLMYFSKMIISSGDSMAREGAILGVPSVYCGSRAMKVNEILLKPGIMFWVKPENISLFISGFYAKSRSREEQERIRNELSGKWIDINQFIYSRINHYRK